MNRLNGKIALITGGASGIGLASAQRLIDEGAFVFMVGRRQEALDNAAEALGSNARGIQADVTKPEDLERVFDTVQKEKGRLDVLVANAGVGEFASLGEITEEHYDYIFDINVKGTLFTVRRPSPDDERRLHHPHRFHGRQHGHPRDEYLQRLQGGRPKSGAQLGL